jgi:hypothetical protein
MLTLFGQPARYCDGISRRGFLKIGGFTFGSAASLALPDILRAESLAGRSASKKAVINVFLGGGPPHQDMWDIKTDAPREIRGEFDPIATNVAGIEIGECFPRIAGGWQRRSSRWIPVSDRLASQQYFFGRRSTQYRCRRWQTVWSLRSRRSACGRVGRSNATRPLV